MNRIISKHKDELTKICESLNIKRMNVFGSAVSGKFNDKSDIDFLIKFSEELSGDEYTENYFVLHYKLREIFKREIDIITESSLSNPYLIESINNSKELIYEA
jgi:predicted nucleotidyltransferase